MIILWMRYSMSIYLTVRPNWIPFSHGGFFFPGIPPSLPLSYKSRAWGIKSHRSIASYYEIKNNTRITDLSEIIDEGFRSPKIISTFKWIPK
jgi:hypothetical protein